VPHAAVCTKRLLEHRLPFNARARRPPTFELNGGRFRGLIGFTWHCSCRLMDFAPDSFIPNYGLTHSHITTRGAERNERSSWMREAFLCRLAKGTLFALYSKLVLFNGPRRLLVFYYTQKPKLAKHLAVLLIACVLLFGFKSE